MRIFLKKLRFAPAFLGSMVMATTLSGCGDLSDLLRGITGGRESEAQPVERMTRAMVRKADIAMIRVYFNEADSNGLYFQAIADNNNTVSYGKGTRAYFVMRGGLVTTSYAVGNDLLDVAPNADDPIQSRRSLRSWPVEVVRRYRIPGDGVEGRLIDVRCSYARKGKERITILGHAHNTTLMSETCHGEGFNNANIYYVANNGFIWKSEQWVGDNEDKLRIEIVEPVD